MNKYWNDKYHNQINVGVPVWNAEVLNVKKERKHNIKNCNSNKELKYSRYLYRGINLRALLLEDNCILLTEFHSIPYAVQLRYNKNLWNGRYYMRRKVIIYIYQSVCGVACWRKLQWNRMLVSGNKYRTFW
jgi:hypothetical protein